MIIAAVGLLGVVAMESTIIPQQQQRAFAAGYPHNTPAPNASKGRCLHG